MDLKYYASLRVLLQQLWWNWYHNTKLPQGLKLEIVQSIDVVKSGIFVFRKL